MENQDELIIGIEINRAYSNIGYFDLRTEEVVNIDTSGGYGKSYFPNAVIFVKGTGEWIFGESAINSDIYDDTIIFESILDIACKNDEIISIDGYKVKVVEVLKEYLTDLMENLFNINPTSVVKKITVYCEKSCEEVFLKSFELIGILNDKVDFVLLDNIIVNSVEDINNFEAFYLGDKNSFYANSNGIISYENINYNIIEESIYSYFEKIYKENFVGEEITEHTKWKLKSLVYHNKELLFNKYSSKQICKVYFNFCYPAIECKIPIEDLEKIFSSFSYDKNIFQGNDIYIVGIGLNWDFILKEICKEKKYKKVSIINEIINLSYFGLSDKIKDIRLEKRNKVKNDIGIIINDKKSDVFFPILKKDQELPFEKFSYDFYLADKENNLIDIVEKGESLKVIATIDLGTIERFSRIEISCECEDENTVNFRLADKGLGNLIKNSDYNFSLSINL